MLRLLPARVARRFARQQDGAAAVEFALVALPFLALTFAILETALVFFAGQTLEAAAADAGAADHDRPGADRRLQRRPISRPRCATHLSGGLFDCANGVYVDVKTYASFAAVNTTPPVTNGQLDTTNMAYTPGGAGQHRRRDAVLPVADLRVDARRQPVQSERQQPPAGGDVGVPQRTLR